MVIGQPEAITVAVLVTDVLCNGLSTGEIDITPDKGTPPYTFLWTGAGVVPGSEDQTGLAAGLYNVTVTDDNSCSSTNSCTAKRVCLPTSFSPLFFTKSVLT